MPIFLQTAAERLPLHFPPPPAPITDAQALWPLVKAELLAAGADWTERLRQMDVALAMHAPVVEQDEIATFYFHRLLPDERERLRAASTERGDMNLEKLWLLASQAALDGWDEGPAFVTADLKPVPVPTAATPEERRAALAEIAYYLPPSVREAIGVAACGEQPSFLLHGWRQLYRANSSLPIDAPSTSIPVPIVEASTLKTNDVPPVTGADSPHVPT